MSEENDKRDDEQQQDGDGEVLGGAHYEGTARSRE